MYKSYVKPFLKKIKKSIAPNNKLDVAASRYYYYDESVKSDLLIFDDFLPNLFGSWRAVEIGAYLKEFDKAQLVCFLSFYDEQAKNIQFEKDKNLFIEKFGIWSKAKSILRINNAQPVNVNTKLAYCLFYHNIRSIYPVLQKYQVPFLFTLYPGGDFAFYNEESDLFLKQISESHFFKGVIVTQQSIYDYLVDRDIFKKSQLSLIYGSCCDVSRYNIKAEKKYFGKNKSILDLCFVAAKYTRWGFDKGFDLFCHVAFILCKKYDFLNFHVIGDFSKDDLPFQISKDKIFFYGIKSFEWFEEFYSNIDIIISPVRPNVLKVGAFDGFPTAAVTDAGLFQVLMMSSDPLGDNSLPQFKNWEEMVITENNMYSLVRDVEKLIEYPDLITKIAKAGRKKVLSILASKAQIESRINLIKENIH